MLLEATTHSVNVLILVNEHQSLYPFVNEERETLRKLSFMAILCRFYGKRSEKVKKKSSAAKTFYGNELKMLLNVIYTGYADSIIKLAGTLLDSHTR